MAGPAMGSAFKSHDDDWDDASFLSELFASEQCVLLANTTQSSCTPATAPRPQGSEDGLMAASIPARRGQVAARGEGLSDRPRVHMAQQPPSQRCNLQQQYNLPRAAPPKSESPQQYLPHFSPQTGESQQLYTDSHQVAARRPLQAANLPTALRSGGHGASNSDQAKRRRIQPDVERRQAETTAGALHPFTGAGRCEGDVVGGATWTSSTPVEEARMPEPPYEGPEGAAVAGSREEERDPCERAARGLAGCTQQRLGLRAKGMDVHEARGSAIYQGAAATVQDGEGEDEEGHCGGYESEGGEMHEGTAEWLFEGDGAMPLDTERGRTHARNGERRDDESWGGHVAAGERGRPREDTPGGSGRPDSAAPRATNTGEDEPCILAWLKSIQMERYHELFLKEEVDARSLPHLSHKDLRVMGVVNPNDRLKLLDAIPLLTSAPPTTPHLSGPSTAPPASTDPTKLWPLFQPRSGKEGDSDAGSGVDGTPDRAPPPRASSRGSAGQSGWAGQRGGDRSPPPWVLIPDTPSFIVDGFAATKHLTSLPTRAWFLTHFHADHYAGLTKGWARGLIYCSPVTAALVTAKLGVPPARLRPLPLLTPEVVHGVRVTCMDANHCPGAVMFLFEPPGGVPTVHTGDFRFHGGMTRCPALGAPHVRGACRLVLDTTYCQPQYTFPPQEEAIQYIVDAIRLEAFNLPSTLFLIGSYTIGKERIFLEVGKALGKPIYIGQAKRKVMQCLKLPPEDARVLTEDDTETNIHVVPMGTLSFPRMEHIMDHYRLQYNTVVAFRPSGWTHSQDRKGVGSKVGGRKKKQGSLVLYEVPYSEHSGFDEMRAFVHWLRPRAIVPLVGNDEGPKRDAMLSLLTTDMACQNHS